MTVLNANYRILVAKVKVAPLGRQVIVGVRISIQVNCYVTGLFHSQIKSHGNVASKHNGLVCHSTVINAQNYLFVLSVGINYIRVLALHIRVGNRILCACHSCKNANKHGNYCQCQKDFPFHRLSLQILDLRLAKRPHPSPWSLPQMSL